MSRAERGCFVSLLIFVAILFVLAILTGGTG